MSITSHLKKVRFHTLNNNFINYIILYTTIFFITGNYLSAAINPSLILTSFSGESLGNASVVGTQGFQFTVGSESVLLTQLGHWDHNLDGLNVSHEVGIWEDNGTLVASATVSAGTVASLVDAWRMVSITPVILSGNTTYRIGSQTNGDNYAFTSSSGISFGPLNSGIASYDSPAFLFTTPGLNFPNNFSSNDRPNANGFITTIPEPTSGLLMGLVGLLIAIRRIEK